MIQTACYGGFPSVDFLVSLFKLYEYSKYTLKNDITWIPIAGSNIYGIRNIGFKIFKNSPYRNLLIIDNDMVFEYKTLEILFERDKDIIMPSFTNKLGGLPDMNKQIIPMATQRLPDGHLRQLTKTEIESTTEPIKVTTNGFGMALFKKRVIEGMDYPYCQGIPMPLAEESPNGIVGEDYYFCIKALEKGFEIWLDPTIQVIHMGVKPYGIWDAKY